MTYQAHPLRIQLSRKKGYRKPEGAVVVSRPSKWGNPFAVKACIEAGFAATIDEARQVCVEAFRDWLRGNGWAAGASPNWERDRAKMLSELDELRGKQLACWCPLDKPCHADILCELANQEA